MIKELSDGQALWQEIVKRISGGQRTNLFLSEEEVLALVEKRRVSRMDFSGGVYFFAQEEDYIRLYYFLEKKILPEVLPVLPEPIILEEVALASKERMPSEEDWKRAGLQPYLQRKRLYLMAKTILPLKRAIKFATVDQLTEIFSTMQDNFEPYTSALPTEEELRKEILAKRVLVSLRGKELLGFLHFGENKQGSMLWHIAVMPQARGMGVAEGLTKDWFFAQKEGTKKFLLWVRTDNPPALRLYEKLGFLPDGRIAPVMIKTTKQRG